MRSLSVAFAIGAVQLTALTGKTISSRRVGSAPAFLVAISPWLGYYSQNARNNTLGALMVAASSYFTIRYAPRRMVQKSGLSYVALIGLSAIFVQTALVFLAVHPVTLALARPWEWVASALAPLSRLGLPALGADSDHLPDQGLLDARLVGSACHQRSLGRAASGHTLGTNGVGAGSERGLEPYGTRLARRCYHWGADYLDRE